MSRLSLSWLVWARVGGGRAYSDVAVGLVLGVTWVFDRVIYPKLDSWFSVSDEDGLGLGTVATAVGLAAVGAGAVVDERELPALERAVIQGTWFLDEFVEAESEQ